MKARNGIASTEMQRSWRLVFLTERPALRFSDGFAFRKLFVEAIEEFMFLYPLDGYYLTTDHLASLQFAMVESGESRILRIHLRRRGRFPEGR